MKRLIPKSSIVMLTQISIGLSPGQSHVAQVAVILKTLACAGSDTIQLKT